MSERQTQAGNLANLQTCTLDMLNNFCFDDYASMDMRTYDRIYAKLKVFDGWRV